MASDARMFNSINTNGNNGYDSITFGDNSKGKVKGLGKIAISNDTSIGGNKYGLVIVDDYTRYTWVFFLVDKSDVFATLLNFDPVAPVNF